jgi:hypothetical protein
LAQLMQMQRQRIQEEKKDDNDDMLSKLSGMSKSEINQLWCVICSKAPNTNINQLPAWINVFVKKVQVKATN